MLGLYVPQVSIVAEISSVKEGLKKIDSLKPDLIFLDIELSDGTGFQLLDGLNLDMPHVIFTTAFDNYAIKAIKFNALDYLLKPIDHVELKKSIEKYENVNLRKDYKKLFQNYKDNSKTNDTSIHKIVIPNGDKKTFVPINKIVKCTAEKSYTWIYLNDDSKLLSSKNLGEFEKILPKPENNETSFFLRVHHSTIVNSEYIKAYQSSDLELTLINEETIKVSHRKKSLLKHLSIN
jgi:two-component system LytT family response regulator